MIFFKKKKTSLPLLDLEVKVRKKHFKKNIKLK